MQKKSQANANGPQAANRGNFIVPPKVKAVKWRIGQPCPVPITLEQGLNNNSILVHAATPATSRSVVVHPPIGVTPLGEDEWVFSQQGDIPLLLSRKDNPERARVLEKRQKQLYQAAVDAGIFTYVNGKLYYPGTPGEDRATVRKHLRDAFKARHPSTEKFTEAMVLAEAPDEVRECERKFAELSRDPELMRKIEMDNPETYETRGGPLADQSQVAVPSLKGKTTVQVLDYIMNAIHDYGALEQRYQEVVQRLALFESANAEQKA